MENKNGGIGFLGLLMIALIVLKLIGTIDWSWWLILSPIWVPIAICVIALIVVGIFKLFK